MTDQPTIMITPTVGFYIAKIDNVLIAYDYQSGEPIFELIGSRIRHVVDCGDEVEEYGYLDKESTGNYCLKKLPLMQRIPLITSGLIEAFTQIVRAEYERRNAVDKV